MKTNTNKVLLPLLAFALLFSVACDYASVTAPEPIEAQSTLGASPANDINSENDTLSKKGGKKDKNTDDGSDDGSTGKADNGNTRYGWGF